MIWWASFTEGHGAIWRAFLALAVCMTAALGCGNASQVSFDSRRAYRHIEQLCKIGPRPVGTEANQEAADYISSELSAQGWDVEKQELAHRNEPVRNVVGKKGNGPLIIIGTHYDTRPLADKDPADRSRPVMGANDGGSGVGVLLELARCLDASATSQAEIWLAFFDAENMGDVQGWSYSVGAAHMADSLLSSGGRRPAYVVVIDMVGDQNQQLYYEWSSVLWLQERIWRIADDLGYSAQFIAQHRHDTLNDHTPFLRWGIPAALIVDLDYPYWGTRYDTLDKIDRESLQRVGQVLEQLLEGEPFAQTPDIVVRTES